MPAEKNEKLVGKVAHYYTKLSVSAIELSDDLSVGDEIRVSGHTTDFTQKVDSMQIDGKDVEKASKGDSVGLKVAEHTRENDEVYKVQ